MKKCQSGFTLVELMIGITLSLISSIAIFTTLGSFETQRKIASGGSEMQQNGLIALYTIEQDVRVAGAGLIDNSTTPGKLPCVKIKAYNPLSEFNASPVLISDGSAGTDILSVARFISDSGGLSVGGGVGKITSSFSSSPSSIDLDSTKAIKSGDFIVVAQDGLDCALMKVSSVSSSTNINTVSAGNYSGVVSSDSSFPSFSAGLASIYNLGGAGSSSMLGPSAASFMGIHYQVDANYDLIRSEDNGVTWDSVASGIVAVAAQYGVATAGGKSVSCWSNATGNDCSGSNWASPSITDIKRVKAIRVAVVARSGVRMQSCAAQPISWSGGVIDLSANPQWNCYRYKVYETVIPLRNVIFGAL